jgi:hypothetical protein
MKRYSIHRLYATLEKERAESVIRQFRNDRRKNERVQLQTRNLRVAGDNVRLYVVAHLIPRERCVACNGDGRLRTAEHSLSWYRCEACSGHGSVPQHTDTL